MPMQVNDEWQELLAELAGKTNTRIVYVLGAIDSGKTTLTRFLIENLAKKFSTADIDCDPGQSRIGPPTTLGLKIYSAAQPQTEESPLRFIGSNSPYGYELHTLAAIIRLVKCARDQGAQRIILDSSGFVIGAAAREFQIQVIDALQPDYVIAVQHIDELEGLLANFKKHPHIAVKRLTVSIYVKSRSMEARQEYRRNRYRDYFKEASMHDIAIDDLGYHGKLSEETGVDVLHNLLISLCDVDNFTLALGIIRDTDAVKRVLRIYAPAFDRGRVTAIHFGSIYLDPVTYQEL